MKPYEIRWLERTTVLNHVIEQRPKTDLPLSFLSAAAGGPGSRKIWSASELLRLLPELSGSAELLLPFGRRRGIRQLKGVADLLFAAIESFPDVDASETKGK